jgi:hypothetical protein
VYSDVDGTTPATNPIIADGDGFWPQRYVTEDAKAVVTTSADVALYTLDPAPTAQGTGAAASAVSFSPTLDLPQTNVQDAIEAAAALGISGFTPFGLGVTGNATLLANIDATGTGAGAQRFDGTTTGTYPTGIVAADTGLVEQWRQTAATAFETLFHATSNKVMFRRMAASVWGAWREFITVSQGSAEGDMIYRGASDFARLPKGTAGQALVMNSGATAPEWGSASLIKAWAVFDSQQVSGTYSRTGTLVTVTITAHGMTTGQYARLDFTSGTASDGYYQITSTGADTFTVTDAVSGSTSGNVTRIFWMQASLNISDITRSSAGTYAITFATPMSDAYYAIIGTADARINHPGLIVAQNWSTASTASTANILVGVTGASTVVGTFEDADRVSVVFIR